MPAVIICADDYGYGPGVDEGILEAARAGAIDAVGAMVDRELDPEPLAATGVEIGLHLELDGDPDSPRADQEDRTRARAEVRRQLELFRELFGADPAFLNGHHHSHARPGIGVVISDLASAHGAAIRSIDARHRRLLRCRGVPTPDLLVGRLDEEEAADPGLGELEVGEGAVAEWMVHPGRPTEELRSAYSRGRVEDLELVLRFTPPDGWSRARFSDLAPA